MVSHQGGVSTGYKTPDLSQLVNGIMNFTGQGIIPVYGNSNLKPESSVNYELSVLSDNEYFSASITGFFTNFKDKIATNSIENSQEIPHMAGTICDAIVKDGKGRCSYNINKDGVTSYGMELFGELKPLDVGYGDISLNAAYTLNKTQDAKGGPVFSYGAVATPLHNFNAALMYNSKYFGVSLRTEVKAMQHRDESDEVIKQLGKYYKPYALVHLGFNFNITKQFKANFAIYNLFNFNFVDYGLASVTDNKGVVSQSYFEQYNYIREGRRYYLSLSYEF